MAITPISGTDTVSYIDQPTGTRANAIVVLPVASDGTSAPAGTSTSPTNSIQRGSSTIATNQISVATTNTQIVAARSGRSRVTITNLGTTDVFIGATGVTTTAGQLLAGTKGTSITLHTAAAVFGIVGAGTQSVSYIEEY